MNSRRFMSSMGDFLPYALSARRPTRALGFRTSNLPQGGRQVLGADLNCPESGAYQATQLRCNPNLGPEIILKPTRLFSKATRVLVTAMEEAQVKRLICVTGFGATAAAAVGRRRDVATELARFILARAQARVLASTETGRMKLSLIGLGLLATTVSTRPASSAE
jgi:hypothetical protein